MPERNDRCTTEAIPDRIAHADDSLWDEGGNRLNIVVDCRILRELLTGEAVLSQDFARPLLVRVGRLLGQLPCSNIKPWRDVNSYITWRPRAYNRVADHLCNAAMDSQVSTTWEDPEWFRMWRNGGCLQLYSDGGYRNKQLAALGWALYMGTLAANGLNWKLVAWSSQNLQGCQDLNAFVCEALALEDGVRYVANTTAKSCADNTNI